MSDDDICENRHGGEKTSVLTNESIRAQKAAMRQTVLDAITASCDANSYEIEQATGLPHQTVSARLTELKRDGLIVATGERRPTQRQGGKGGAVYRRVSSVVETLYSGRVGDGKKRY